MNLNAFRRRRPETARSGWDSTNLVANLATGSKCIHDGYCLQEGETES